MTNKTENTIKDKIEGLKKCVEIAKSLYENDKEKYGDAIFAYNWLISTLLTPSKQHPNPNKKQRKHAIDVTVEIEEQVEKSENIKNKIKAVAEFAKNYLDKQKI